MFDKKSPLKINSFATIVKCTLCCSINPTTISISFDKEKYYIVRMHYIMEMCLSGFRTDIKTGGQAFSTSDELLLLEHHGVTSGRGASGLPACPVPAESGASASGRIQRAFCQRSDLQPSFTYLFFR